jgi:hypothetical protein
MRKSDIKGGVRTSWATASLSQSTLRQQLKRKCNSHHVMQTASQLGFCSISSDSQRLEKRPWVRLPPQEGEKRLHLWPAASGFEQPMSVLPSLRRTLRVGFEERIKDVGRVYLRPGCG